MAKKNPLPPVDRQLLSTEETFHFLGISRIMLYEMRRRELLIEPVRIGDRNFWRPDELRDWCRAGCPDPERWVWRPKLLLTIEEALRREGPQLVAMRKEAAVAEGELADTYERIRKAKEKLQDLQHQMATVAAARR